MLQVKKLASFNDLKRFDFSSVGFFQTSEYLQIFAKHFCKEEDVIILGIFEGKDLIGYGCFEKIGDENSGQILKSVPTNNNFSDVGGDFHIAPQIVFLGMKKVLGNQEVTDYGDIVLLPTTDYQLLTDIWSLILEWFKENGFKKVELDYVRNSQFQIPNSQVKIEEEEVAPYVDLPESWEAYVSSLEYKNRRELRRKINRLEKSSFAKVSTFVKTTVDKSEGQVEKAGKYLFSCMDTSSQSNEELQKNFQEFVRLVKLSESEKEKFMTREMEEFFWDLCMINNNSPTTTKDIWTPVLNFLTIDNKSAACILTFENGVEALAYNSGYDPEFIYFSPGFLSHAFKIKQLIEKSSFAKASEGQENYKKYDFLRGSERYKFDLGAKEEKLYKITATV